MYNIIVSKWKDMKRFRYQCCFSFFSCKPKFGCIILLWANGRIWRDSGTSAVFLICHIRSRAPVDVGLQYANRRESLKHRYHQVGKRQKLPLTSLANPPMASGASTTNGTNGLIWLTDNFTIPHRATSAEGEDCGRCNYAQKGRTFLIIHP